MPQKRGADLHIHSVFSDGTSTPQELAELAQKAALSTIALTDHDSVEGLDAAEEACRKRDIRIIAGTELSTDFGDVDCHIIGLFADYKDERLLGELERLRRFRRERIYEICNRLDSLGTHIEPAEVLRIASGASPGRPHVARALLQAGQIKTMSEAFWKYIGDGGPAYVPKVRLSTPEAVELLRSAQAMPILCHPGYRPDEYVIRQFKDMGVEGIEAYSPEFGTEVTEAYLKIAKKLDLGVSGGSDFHGWNREEVMLGSVRVPDEYVEDLFARRKRGGTEKGF